MAKRNNNLSGKSHDELEAEKLRIEIQELSKPWFLNPRYLGVILPTLVGIFTVYVTFFTDIINEKIVLYESQIENLRHDKDSIQKISASFLDSIEVANDSLDKIWNDVYIKDSILSYTKSDLNVLVKNLKDAEAELDNAYDQAASDVDRIEILRNAVNKIRQQQKSQAEEHRAIESVLIDSVKSIIEQLHEVQSGFEYYKTINIALTPVERNLILMNRQQQQQQWQQQQQLQQWQQQQQQQQGG